MCLFFYIIYIHRLTWKTQKERLFISSNENFSPIERDIIIVWLNSSCRNHIRYSVNSLLPALTRAKKAIYIGGDLSDFMVCI